MQRTENPQEKVCRICLQSDNLQMIRPCECKGSVSYVHKHCETTWILKVPQKWQQSGQNSFILCQLCKGNIYFRKQWVECPKVCCQQLGSIIGIIICALICLGQIGVFIYLLVIIIQNQQFTLIFLLVLIGGVVFVVTGTCFKMCVQRIIFQNFKRIAIIDHKNVSGQKQNLVDSQKDLNNDFVSL